MSADFTAFQARTGLGRSGILVVLALGLLLAPASSPAQQSKHVPRVGCLSLSAGPLPRAEAFRQGLRELGYVEGQNIVLEWRWAASHDRLAQLAAELVRLKVDVLVTDGTSATLAARGATTTTPIVMAGSADPVATGLATSLARPGGNITGLSFVSPELSGKRLELLKDVFPNVSRVTVLWDPENPSNAIQLNQMQVVARSLRMKLRSLAVRNPKELDAAFAAIAHARPDALVVTDSAILFDQRTRIAAFATKSRLPTICGLSGCVDTGLLMFYGASLSDLHRRAATYVDKILKGAEPADLPIEQATKFELVINLKTAKALGLTIPESVLIRADEVIR
jgi:putative ABC transport system substrate-binding protein